MDAESRSVQLAMVHPDRLPQSIAAIVTAPPASVTRSGIADLLATRLPLPASTGIFRE
jgi:hypothetical protein